MRFLRERRGEVESVSASDRYTAKQRSDALDVLRGVVVIVKHPYQADPYSGAGNCWCGRAERNALHAVIFDPSVGPTTETEQ